MKHVTVRDNAELALALDVAGLTPAPLPTLPVVVGDTTYEWPLIWSRELGDVAAGDNWESHVELVDFLKWTRRSDWYVIAGAIHASDDAMAAALALLEEECDKSRAFDDAILDPRLDHPRE